jgi:8-oxo-dGTP pyrophosphatase MutT (NUDIX family)
MNIKKGPWTTISSKSVYKNQWIEVSEDEVIRPDGKEGIFGVVEMQPGVSVLPIDDEGYVYLVKEYKYAVEQETIEVIAGGIDQNESVLAAAKRELKEESGILADEFVDLGRVDPFTSIIKSPNYMFLARQLKFSNSNLEGTEKIEVIKISLDDVFKMVMESKITNGVTVSLILKAKEYLSH